MKKPNNPNKKKSVIPGKLAKKERDSEIDMQNALRLGSVIWEEWKDQLKVMAENKRLFTDDLPKLVNILAAQVQSEIKEDYVKNRILDNIDHDLAKLPMFAAFMKFTKNYIVHCPHKVTVNNVESDCNWTGRVRLMEREFKDGIASCECQSCGKTITADDISDPRVEARP